MFQRLRSLFEGKPKLKDPVNKVFSLEGKAYYEFKDISKIKCQRALTANDFWNELSMRATREYLQNYTKAVDVILGSTKIDIFKLKTLNMQLQERLDMIYETDIIYKIASVVYFTKDEDPYEYDDLLGREKIKLFKKQGDGFFFGTLFTNLISLPDISDKDLQTYMKVGQEIKMEHLRTISTILSRKRETNA